MKFIAAAIFVSLILVSGPIQANEAAPFTPIPAELLVDEAVSLPTFNGDSAEVFEWLSPSTEIEQLPNAAAGSAGEARRAAIPASIEAIDATGRQAVLVTGESKTTHNMGIIS